MSNNKSKYRNTVDYDDDELEDVPARFRHLYEDSSNRGSRRNHRGWDDED